MKEIKPNKCKCGFQFPRPMKVEDGEIVRFNNKEYPEQFFCDFCKGLIVNNIDFIKEVINMLAYERWGTLKWNLHRNKDRELEEGRAHYLNVYKSLI